MCYSCTTESELKLNLKTPLAALNTNVPPKNILFTEDEELKGFSDVEWDSDFSKLANQQLAC